MSIDWYFVCTKCKTKISFDDYTDDGMENIFYFIQSHARISADCPFYDADFRVENDQSSDGDYARYFKEFKRKTTVPCGFVEKETIEKYEKQKNLKIIKEKDRSGFLEKIKRYLSRN